MAASFPINSTIDADTTGFEQGTKRAGRAAATLSTGLGKVDERSRGAARGMDRAARAGNALRGVLAGVVAGLSFRQLDRGRKAIIATISEFEDLTNTLHAVSGSLNLAKQEMRDIAAFAASTPFEVGDLTQSFIQLKAFGLDPTIESLEGLGNAAAIFKRDILDVATAATSGEVEPLRRLGIQLERDGNRAIVKYKDLRFEVENNSKAIAEAIIRMGREGFQGGLALAAGSISNIEANAIDSRKQWAKLVGDLTDADEAYKDLLQTQIDLWANSEDLAVAVGETLTIAFRNLNALISSEGFQKALKFLAEHMLAIAGAATGFAAGFVLSGFNPLVGLAGAGIGAGLGAAAEYDSTSFEARVNKMMRDNAGSMLHTGTRSMTRAEAEARVRAQMNDEMNAHMNDYIYGGKKLKGGDGLNRDENGAPTVTVTPGRGYRLEQFIAQGQEEHRLDMLLASGKEELLAQELALIEAKEFLRKQGIENPELTAGEAERIREITSARMEQIESLALISDMAETVEDGFTAAFTAMVVNFKDAGESIKNIARGVVNDLIQMYIRSQITAPLFGAIFGGFGGGGGTAGLAAAGAYGAGGPTAALHHGGGMAGHSPHMPGGEMLAVLRRNEEILPASDPRHVMNRGRGAAMGGNTYQIHQTINGDGDPQLIRRATHEALAEAVPGIVEASSNATIGRLQENAQEGFDY